MAGEGGIGVGMHGMGGGGWIGLDESLNTTMLLWEIKE